MADIDITLFCNSHRLDAMTRVLAEQGLTIEQALYPALDKEINVYSDETPAEDASSVIKM